VEFVKAQIAEAAEVRRGDKVPSIGLCFGGGKIGNSTFSAIESDVDRIWIGGDVGVDSSVAEDPDGDAEEIVFVLLSGVTGGHPNSVVLVHYDGGDRGGVVRGVEELQGDLLGGGRLDLDFDGHEVVIVDNDAEASGVVVEIVENTGILNTGCVLQLAAWANGEEGELSLKRLLKSRDRNRGGDLQDGVARELGVMRELILCQRASGGEGDLGAPDDAAVSNVQSAGDAGGAGIAVIALQILRRNGDARAIHPIGLLLGYFWIDRVFLLGEDRQNKSDCLLHPPLFQALLGPICTLTLSNAKSRLWDTFEVLNSKSLEQDRVSC